MAKKKRPFSQQMQAVRQQTPPSDYGLICTLAESSHIYPFPGLGNTFPKEEKSIPNSDFRNLKALDVSRELALQVARLNHHATKLASALESLAQINGYLARGEFELAETAIADHKYSYGLSLVLAKKDLLLAVERHGLRGLSKRFKALTNGQDGTAWAVLNRYVYDLMDPTYDPFRAARMWLHVSAGQMATGEWFSRVLQDETLTRSPTDVALSSALLRYSAVSLLDLAVLIWRKRTAHPEDTRVQHAFHSLDGSLTEIFVQKFSQFEIGISEAYNLSDELPPDIEIYRTSFFFDDIATVTTWRCHVNRLIFADELYTSRLGGDDASLRLDEAAVAIAARPAQSQESVENLRFWETSFLRPGSEISDQKFLTAALVGESLRIIERNKQGDAASVAHLLASTDDVHLFVSGDTLKTLLEAELGRSSPLLCFVLWEMIYRQARTQDNELERRVAFMRLFSGGSGTTIIQLLDNISTRSLSTALLMAKVCTRTFLERLYLMMTSVKDVLEARLQICRWLVDRAGEAADSLNEESDALARELANLEARSDLDSTRVHVDEDSLREWFYETQQALVTRYIQTVLAEGPSGNYGVLLNFYSNKEKTDATEGDFIADTQIGSEFLLVGIVDATLKAFTQDRTFGLDAYLSRRIRHGTLSGHIMTPVTRVLKKLSELSDIHEMVHNSGGLSGIDSFIEDWRKFLVGELDHIRKDVIQIRADSHPNGLIRATWQTAANIATWTP